jgi:hypothetical protein
MKSLVSFQASLPDASTFNGHGTCFPSVPDMIPKPISLLDRKKQLSVRGLAEVNYLSSLR